MKICRKLFISLLLTLSISLTCFSQVNVLSFEAYISNQKNTIISNASRLKMVKTFYAKCNYQFRWLQKENTRNFSDLFEQLSNAATLGLEENDYQFNYLQLLRKGGFPANTSDSFEAELRMTDAALHFYNDLAYGNTSPAFGYNGLKYTPACFDIPGLVLKTLETSSLKTLLNEISPLLPEYLIIKDAISRYLQVMSPPDFSEVMINSNKVSAGNTKLQVKLYQLGFLEKTSLPATDSLLKEKIKQAQLQFGLKTDGILQSTLLTALNYTLTNRLQQLKLALNYYRWLSCLVKHEPSIVVNIPAAYLKVYFKTNSLLDMRMVVGKKSTPTPTLTSRVSEVVLYPYWHVPNSIATKELLPRIKRNPGYIDANNYQVLNKAGNIVNPYAVNWKGLSRNYFPYLIRQSTGCDNALGLLKLNFPSPFDVYLHDTPVKNAFGLKRRYLSHGCMRMEKPMEMGHMILKYNAIAIDTLEQKGCLRNQAPIMVKADVNMPVIVWYNPVGIDASGNVLFFEDVYEKFSWMKN